MDWKWAGRTVAVAAATVALALSAGLPLIGIAEAPKVEEVKVAEAKQGGCTVELFAGKTEYKPGETPALFLKLTNSSATPEEVEVTVSILGTPPVSEMSRMAFTPSNVLWKHSGKLLVAAGEAKRLDLPVDLKAPEKQSLSFGLQVGRQPMERAVLSTPGQLSPQKPAASTIIAQ